MFSKSISWVFCLGALLTACKVDAADNVVFLNNPSPQDVQDMGRYIVKGYNKPFFSGLVLFAANIDGSKPSLPVLSYNHEMKTMLDDNISIIRALQKQGIKVQIAYLGNHQNAGWSCDMTNDVAGNLADAMVADVVKYKLDGISIDDEYSTCSGSTSAFYAVLNAIQSNKDFKGKILSKALWSDSWYFSGKTNVAKFLGEGYEMTYNGDVSDLQPYNNYGMPKNSLYLGISPGFTTVDDVGNIARNVVSDQYAGVMLWAPNSYFESTDEAATYYTQIIQAEIGRPSSVEYKIQAGQ